MTESRFIILNINSLIVTGAVILLTSWPGAAESSFSATRRVPGGDAGASRGSFTGTGVPSLLPLRGDFVAEGVFTPGKRTDIPRLLEVLQQIGAQDYMHMVWNEKRYPSAWEDFQLMAPEFQKANIGLWLYLIPPSRNDSAEPFGPDYVRWAVECAKIARAYPAVKGLCIDDFNGAVKTLTPAYCKQMMAEAHKIAPRLALLVVCYFGYEKTITEHVESGAIDGVIFPYFYPHRNLTDTTKLRPQIEAYRAWLDEHTKRGGLSGRMPLVVMVYAEGHSESRDKPTPAYVKECLQSGLECTKEGLADGVVTYCLPKDNPAFVNSVAEVYQGWKAK